MRQSDVKFVKIDFLNTKLMCLIFKIN